MAVVFVHRTRTERKHYESVIQDPRTNSQDELSTVTVTTTAFNRNGLSTSPRKRLLSSTLLNEDEAPPPSKRIHSPTVSFL